MFDFFPKKLVHVSRIIIIFVMCGLSITAPVFVFADTQQESKESYCAQNDVLYVDCNPKCATSSSAQQLPGDNNAEQAYNYLITNGYSPEQAAGIVGNMILESGVNPERLQGTGLNELTPDTAAASSGSGWGIVQWTPAGKAVTAINNMGGDPNSLLDQLKYLTSGNKLNGGANGDAADKVKATNNVNDATQAFGQYYESPANLGASIDLRQTYAQAIYNKATQGTAYPPEVAAAIYSSNGNAATPLGAITGSTGATASTPQGGTCAASASDNGECKNPFRDLQNSAPMRFDGGLDYGGANGGSGPIYAACPAQITLVQASGSGWPGTPGSYVAYKMTAGKAKDLYMYIAEDCTPTVKVGDTVTTDQPICNYVDKGTHLETGWSEGGQNMYVKWSDYNAHDRAGQNGYASNSGIDVGKFLSTLGVGEGHVDTSGPSPIPPPSDWPKW